MGQSAPVGDLETRPPTPLGHRILLFDEPINGLDPDGVRWFRSLIAGLAGEGRAVLLSSHLISEMELSADHLIVIGEGAVEKHIANRRGRDRSTS